MTLGRALPNKPNLHFFLEEVSAFMPVLELDEAYRIISLNALALELPLFNGLSPEGRSLFDFFPLVSNEAFYQSFKTASSPGVLWHNDLYTRDGGFLFSGRLYPNYAQSFLKFALVLKPLNTALSGAPAENDSQALINLLDSSSDGTIILSQDHKIIFVNQIFQLYFMEKIGRSLDIGEDITLLLPAAVLKKYHLLLKEVLMKQHLLVHRQLELAPGYSIEAEIKFVAIYKDDGYLRGIAIQISDITEHQKIRLDLTDEAPVNEFIIKKINVGVLLVSLAEDRIISANKAATNYLGFPIEELKGIQSNSLLAEDASVLSSYLHERRSSKNYYGLLRFKRKDGGLIVCEVNASEVRTTSGDLQATIIFKDITGEDSLKKKLADKHTNLLALINNTGDMLVSVDSDFKLLEYNTKFYYYGFAGFGKYPQSGLSFFDFVTPADLPATKSLLDRVRATHTREFFATEPISPQSEKRIDLESLFAPVIDAAGEFIGVAISIRDQSVRNSNEQIVRRTHELQDANSADAKIGSLENDLVRRKLFRTSQTTEALPYDFKRAKVLLVEDSLISREIIKAMLESLNCEVLEAENGAVALNLLRDFEAELILMDILMPVKDGYAASKEVRENALTSAIPIIAVTALALSPNEEGKVMYCDDYIPKPVRSARLNETLARFLKCEAKEGAGQEGEGTPIVMQPDELGRRYGSEYRQILKLMSNDDIREFCSSLKNYADKTNEVYLAAHSSRIIKNLNTFDFDKIHSSFLQLKPLFEAGN